MFLLVAVIHRLDEGPFTVGRVVACQIFGSLDRGVRSRGVGGGHRAVQVRTPSPRLAEVAHGTIRIVLPRLTEGARGVTGREGVQELQPLVEVQLGFVRRRRDRARKWPQALAVMMQWHRLFEARGEVYVLRVDR